MLRKKVITVICDASANYDMTISFSVRIQDCRFSSLSDTYLVLLCCVMPILTAGLNPTSVIGLFPNHVEWRTIKLKT
jgi:hypothetical protein